MSTYNFIGCDLVEDAGSGTPVFNAGLPSTGQPYYALFPMTGERSSTTTPLNEFYPIELTWEAIHKMWWREKLMAGNAIIDWNGFVRGGDLTLERVNLSNVAISDEIDLMNYQSYRWVGAIDESTGGQTRTISVTVGLLAPSTDPALRPYYWNDNNVDMLPRLTVSIEADWDEGTEFTLSGSTENTSGTATGSVTFMGGSISATGNSSTVPTSFTITISVPTFNAFYDWSGHINPDTGDPV